MEIAIGLRGRPRSIPILKASSDPRNDEESGDLLSSGDRNSIDFSLDTDEIRPVLLKQGDGALRDYGRWLRPLSIAFGILVLAAIALTSSTTLLGKPSIYLDIFNLFHIGGDLERSSQQKIGIELDPSRHVFRSPGTITYYWTVTSGFLYPDGVKKEIYLVNGEFPGPTIQCRSGDKLVIRVTNELVAGEGLSIHWHGLQMRNANHMDGAAGFTQCPIPSGEKFTYEFKVDDEQSGTFWWHAHSQVQRGDGLYGGLIVHKPAITHTDMEIYEYRKEVLLLVGDWYHRSAEEVLGWYMSVKGFGNEPVPDSLLINGVGKFHCSMAVPARPVECVDIEKEQTISILPNEVTRVRVVNVGSLAGFTLQANSGTLTPIILDGGHPIVGLPVESVGTLYPGERMDLISKWNADLEINSAAFQISLDTENFKYPNEALRPNQSFPIATITSQKDSSSQAVSIGESRSHFNLASATPSPSVTWNSPHYKTAQQTILLYAKTERLSINSNHPMGSINRTSWAPQSNPSLPLISVPRSSWDDNQFVPYIPTEGSKLVWVDIIINNLDDGSHPFHLHGYDFYVLASHRSEHGWGSYSPFAASGSSAIAPKLNLENPIMKDTVSVPRRGYVILRFLADNPGIWMFHCHVLFHQASGMAMGLHVAGDERNEVFDISAKDLCC